MIHASRFTLGDATISAMEIWGAEYQESNAALVDPKDIDFLMKLGEREKCGIDVVGSITGNGRVVLKDFEEEVGDLARVVRKSIVPPPIKKLHLTQQVGGIFYCYLKWL